jgi:hypothetical protein
MSSNDQIIINIEKNNDVNKVQEEKVKKNITKDSFDKVFNIQKLIHKQAGLKQLCKKN